MQFLSKFRIEYEGKFIAANECVDGGAIISVENDEMFDEQIFIYDTNDGALHSATCPGTVIELKNFDVCESEGEAMNLLKLATKRTSAANDNEINLYQQWWSLDPFESYTDNNFICITKDYFDANTYENIAEIRSKSENDMFLAFARHHNTDTDLRAVYIAGSDREEEKTFLFDDGSSMPFFNWAEGEPNDNWAKEDCIEMYTRVPGKIGQWNDRECSGAERPLLIKNSQKLPEDEYICEKPCTLVDVFQESTQFWKYKHSNNLDEAPSSYFGVKNTNSPAFVVNVDTKKCLAMTTVEVEDTENGLRNIIETVDCNVNPNLNLWFFRDTGERPPHSSDLETKYCVGNVSESALLLFYLVNFDFLLLTLHDFNLEYSSYLPRRKDRDNFFGFIQWLIRKS